MSVQYKRQFKGLALLLSIVVFSLSTQSILAEPDWSAVDKHKVTIFYPGLTSWEMLQTKDHGTGAKPVKKNKKSCAKCHVSKKGEFDIAADEIIDGSLTMSDTGVVFEPKPRAGKGYMDIQLQAAYDAENVYIRVSWPSQGASFKDAAIADQDLADRVSLQWADSSLKTFAKSGCYVTCHDDLKDMPADAGKKLYAEFAMKKGKAIPEKMINMYLSKGRVIDQWVAAFHGAEVVANDEYILQDRVTDTNNLTTSGSYENGQYQVTFTRSLTAAEQGDVTFVPGKLMNVSIAIHENKANSRFHYTSFPVALGFDAKKADIDVTKL